MGDARASTELLTELTSPVARADPGVAHEPSENTATMKTHIKKVGVAMLAALLLAGCVNTQTTGNGGTTTSNVGAPSTSAVGPADTSASEVVDDVSVPEATELDAVASGEALMALETLEVKGRAPKTGYSRDQFGEAWEDVDRNGCDTRNDILQRDLTNIVFKNGNCVVATGTLQDPYTGKTIEFVRGQNTSTAVQIDHVIALSDAWQKGAQQWEPEKRVAFANDPLGLLAVDGPANGAKGDGDAATWLPPNKNYRCDYVARQVAMKTKWGVWVTAAEKEAMVTVLSTCPGQQMPTG